MIEIFHDNSSSVPFGEPYARSGNYFGKFVMPITSRMRAYYALKGLNNLGSHLDIGCGDCLFLKRSPCKVRIGLDVRFGDHVKDTLDFANESFDNVTMLAVIEHIPEPKELIKEIHRVLKPQGRLVITTPKRTAEWLIKIYAKDAVDDQDTGHVAYYEKKDLLELTSGYFKIVDYRTFIFGMNQIIIVEK